MDYKPLQRGSREFDDLMKFFEREVSKTAYVVSFEREHTDSWEKGYYYKNGKTNELWRVYMQAYDHGKRTQYDGDYQ